MSGGHFNYKQYQIGYIVDDIQQIIDCYERDETDDCGVKYRERYSKQEIDTFREGCLFLEMGQIYAQRIDWLLSGDDGTDSFFRRLTHDLNELKEIYAKRA